MRLQEPITKKTQKIRVDTFLNPIKSIQADLKELEPLLKPIENVIKRAFYMCCNCHFRFYCAAHFAEAIGFTPDKLVIGAKSLDKICPFTNGKKKLTWIFTNDMLSDPNKYYEEFKERK